MHTKDRSPGSRKWHAISVKAGKGACKTALELKHKRWLSKDAPKLPLDGCQQPGHCSCVYAHHEDRRAGDGRRAEENDRFSTPKKPSGERRLGRDRRSRPDD